MGTETQRDLIDRTHQAHWAQRRAADAVSDRQARVVAIERDLGEARRRLHVAELELQAATWALDVVEETAPEDLL
jgi:hypothetical protein